MAKRIENRYIGRHKLTVLKKTKPRHELKLNCAKKRQIFKIKTKLALPYSNFLCKIRPQIFKEFSIIRVQLENHNEKNISTKRYKT